MKDSEAILAGDHIDQDAKTRSQAKEIKKITINEQKLKPRIAKHNTMLETSKQSEWLLKDSNIDQDAKTRNQSKTIASLTVEQHEPKPRLKKSSTMEKTALVKISIFFSFLQSKLVFCHSFI